MIAAALRSQTESGLQAYFAAFRTAALVMAAMRLAWQALIAVLVLLGIVEGAASRGVSNQGGAFGYTLTEPMALGNVTVAGVDRGYPAYAAGIRSGDRLWIEPTGANLLVGRVTEPGDREIVRDGSRTIELRAVAVAGGAPLALVLVVYAARLAFLAMAVLVAWRRPDDPAARALATFLACFQLCIGFDLGLLHPLWARLLGLLGVQGLFFVGTCAALAFACRFPTLPQRGFRSTVNRLIVPIAVVGLIVGDGAFLVLYAFTAPAENVRTILATPFLVLFASITITTIAALWNAYRSAEGRDRVRARWVLLTFAFGFSGLIVYFGSLLLRVHADWPQFAALTMLAIPFGLAYVILRHRVLDIGFVINRAVVYAGVSLVVVAAFIIFESLVGLVVEQNSRASVILQLCAALALGLSVRAIHERVDRFVDDLFFRERHAAEAAVRKFAHEALLITSQDDLVIKTVEVAELNLHMSGCAFYTRRANEYAPLHSTFVSDAVADENDYAILDMRAWHAPVDVGGAQTRLPGELAVPMIVRGQLAGFLLCGEKASHEAYAPDERDALALLARDAGIALDSLRIRAIERDLVRLARNGDVPPAIRARLEALAADGATGGGELAL